MEARRELMTARLEGWVWCLLNLQLMWLTYGRLTVVWWNARVDGFFLLQPLFSSSFL